MATRLKRGEIWMYTFAAPDKRRPVLVMSRQDVIPYLSTVTVAPITSTIRGSPGEYVVGPQHGLKDASAVNLDHLQTVEQSRLSAYVGALSDEDMEAVCLALAVALGCSD